MPTFSELVLPEFDEEMARTRKVLAAIPNDKLDFKLGEDFQTVGWNANHLNEIVAWTAGIIAEGSFDIAPVDAPPYESIVLDNVDAILREFDKNVVIARQSLASVTDETLTKEWSLKMAGQNLFTMTKGAAIRKWVFNHSFHHRAILTAHLRQCGVELPSIYEG